MKNLKVLTPDQIETLMVSALEGGSNYWYDIQKKSCDAIRNATTEMKGQPFVMRMIAAIEKGVAVEIHDIEDESTLLGTLTAESWAKGEDLMIQTAVQHFADAVAGNDDATTGDVFFQLALMGEVVYG